MIRAVFDTAAIAAGEPDPESRTIAGVAVPWNVVGRVSSGELVMFHPGSLDAGARPVLVRDHDSRRPIGRVIAANDNGAHMAATARISKTADGDEALVLASPPDQVLGMFSVGADPTRFDYDTAGVLHVHAANWNELSLLPFGAYDGARVQTVTATQGEPMNPTSTMPVATTPTPDPQPATPPDPAPTPPPAPDPAPPADPDAPPTVQAGSPRPAPVALAGGASRPALTLSGVSNIISAGIRNRLRGPDIASRIQAAWTNVTTTDINGIVQPSYRPELVGLIDHGMPLVRALDQRPLPASGMRIEYPKWTALPDSTAKQGAEKTEIGSGDVKIDIAGDDIATWAQGNDISFQALNRSDPSFIDAYLRAAGVDAGRKYDTFVGTTLLATATAATPPTTVTFVNCVAALFAALNPATTPPGPLFLALSYDVGISLIPVTGLGGPAFWNANIAFGDFIPTDNVGGLLTFIDWNLPAKTMLLGSRQAAANYGGPDTSADIRVVDVSLLGVDIGVYFYAALAVEYPQAFAKLSNVTPAVEGVDLTPPWETETAKSSPKSDK